MVAVGVEKEVGKEEVVVVGRVWWRWERRSRSLKVVRKMVLEMVRLIVRIRTKTKIGIKTKIRIRTKTKIRTKERIIRITVESKERKIREITTIKTKKADQMILL